jgi:stearoyl-CoA desaturase (delta-9 desaturase)
MTSQLLEAPPRRRKARRRGQHAAQPVAQPATPPKGTREKLDLVEIYGPDQLRWKNADWVVLGWMAAMHLGALAAPFFFSWTALGVAIGLHWLTASIGICLGYHRFLSHRSLKLRAPARFFVTLCGVLSGEGSPLMWSATHRVHHQRSDKDGDPHSPTEGTFWSHMLWLFIRHDKVVRDKLYEKYTPDLLKDPILVFFERTYGWWLFGSGILLLAVGGLPLFLWAMCGRMVVAYHSTWFVNSATHIWGYRNYDTSDRSRNLWWVALFAYGEGWHNNHHAHPRLARAGHRWWEIDMTFWAIRALQAVGLAYEVDDRIPVGRTAEE